MRVIKFKENEVQMMLNTLDRLVIMPGLDNASTYVGLGQFLQDSFDRVEEEDDGRTDG